MKRTKGFVKFHSRVEYFSTDIELVDLVVKNIQLLKGENVIFKDLKPTICPNLAKYHNADDTRRKAANHLRKTLYVAFVKEIYEEVTEYLIYILKEGAKQSNNIRQLIGEHTKGVFTDYEILSVRSLEAIQEQAVIHIYQQLEAEKSTIELIKKICKKLSLKVDLAIIDDALPYLECRHIFVHSDGIPNKEFITKHPNVTIDKKNRISLSKAFLKNAKDKIVRLISYIDQELINNGIVPEDEVN